MPRHLLFDLDGTLIDSADAILDGFRRVLAAQGLTPLHPLERSLIGPPLRQTLARLAGIEDSQRLEAMAAAFIDWYDREGYRGTRVYPGIPEMLAALVAHGFALHIVTNKRQRPTRLILDWLGWSDWFRRVDTHDLRADQPLGSKSEVLRRLLEEERIAPADALYIGDRVDDQRAAAANRLDCLLVAWGYGAADWLPAGTRVLQSPAELLATLAPA